MGTLRYGSSWRDPLLLLLLLSNHSNSSASIILSCVSVCVMFLLLQEIRFSCVIHTLYSKCIHSRVTIGILNMATVYMNTSQTAVNTTTSIRPLKPNALSSSRVRQVCSNPVSPKESQCNRSSNNEERRLAGLPSGGASCDRTPSLGRHCCSQICIFPLLPPARNNQLPATLTHVHSLAAAQPTWRLRASQP